MNRKDIKLNNKSRNDQNIDNQQQQQQQQQQYHQIQQQQQPQINNDPISRFNLDNHIIPLSKNKSLLLFQREDYLYFHGKILIKSLIGDIDIYGFNINSCLKKYYPVYSPFCSPALSISCHSNTLFYLKDIINNNNTSNSALPDSIIKELESKQQSIDPTTQFSCIAIIKHLSENCENSKMFMKRKVEVFKNNSVDQFYPLYKPDYSVQPLIISQQWIDIIDYEFLSTNKIPSILSCGDKNVGKSTFNRVLVNKLLQKFSHIIYIDTDTGQTEFTPSGLVYIDIINEPLLGPPFTHCKKDVLKSYFFGDTSPKSNPEYYITLVNQVIASYQSIKAKYPNIPVVLNTNGWTKSLGLFLLQEIIKSFQPQSIIHLYNSHSINQHQQGIIFDQNEIDQLNQGTKLIMTPSIAPHGLPSLNIGSSQTRNLMFSNYFGTETTSLLDQVPYQVPWKIFKVKVLTGQVPPSQTMYALNASLVGICLEGPEYKDLSFKLSHKVPTIINGDIQITECVGLGIIRSIDMEHGLFYILTPIPLDTLSKSNTLLKGTLDIPPTALSVSVSSTGSIIVPYNQLDVLSSYGTGADTMNRSKKYRND
ncbi:hypothetical protein CYY_007170 [Polysphondylium violaceum]|uniref:Polynucleotide 5'-hydroxyl-kinase NOL9 n=1 Tax=Polysphondylium violaceum TaxID=133409 RepID=A0A8J4PS88_9MYCE|nr:hypothetical protein CYY_007170 [Polysphondylium violaceum]